MRFYVIYSVDVPKGESIAPYTPKSRAWERTESGETEYDCWTGGKHRKYVAELSRKQFDKFVSQTGLTADTCETMGSLTGCGWMPAISFRAEEYSAIVLAYVTPIPEVSQAFHMATEERAAKTWERVRKAVISQYR